MSPQAGYILQEEIYPRLCSAIPKSVLCVGSEDHQELIQDATVQAARMIDRVESQGKLGKVTASNISYYTIQHLKSGRRASGTSSVDIMGSATQLNGNSRLHSLNEVVSQSESGDEIFELHDVISQDHDDPSVEAARRMDWGVFMAGLNKLERLAVESISAGLTVREICRAVKLTKRRLTELLGKVAKKAVEFMGSDILRELAMIPVWRIGLDCERELFACRAERRNCTSH
jgi:hypothetical protein